MTSNEAKNKYARHLAVLDDYASEIGAYEHIRIETYHGYTDGDGIEWIAMVGFPTGVLSALGDTPLEAIRNFASRIADEYERHADVTAMRIRDRARTLRAFRFVDPKDGT